MRLVSKSIPLFHVRLSYAVDKHITFNFFNDKKQYHNSSSNNKNSKKALLVGGVLSSLIAYSFYNRGKVFLKSGDQNHGKFNPGLPSYGLDEVAKHTEAKSKIWVTYKEGVYDITEFVSAHPGGDQILLAAGSSVEPFWLLYAAHNTPEVLNMLEEMRIGNLSKEDAKAATANMEDPYYNEPRRHAALKAASLKPFNAETPSSLLVDSFLTPNELFYVRNHLPVPEVDPEAYKLEIEVEGSKKTLSLTLDQIKRMPKHTITAAVMCAGNRRSEMVKVSGFASVWLLKEPGGEFLRFGNLPSSGRSLDRLRVILGDTTVYAGDCELSRVSQTRRTFTAAEPVVYLKVKPVKGLNWEAGAVGNATWTGVKLRDVLKIVGVNEDDTTLLHVQFEGLDTDPTHTPYGASIPIQKALDRYGDVILAYEMNGKPLPRDHGFPIRVIVPGVTGARNVKWLGRITVSSTESTSHWQQNDYKGFSPAVDWDTVDFRSSPAIQNLPVTSAICKPSPGQIVQVKDGHVLVQGYAWSGAGQKIVRVDITADKGKTWHVAQFDKQDSSPAPQHWAWTIWSCRVPVSKQATEVQIWAKAVDSTYNTQPECFKNIWNLRGVLSNAYHRVNVTLKWD